MRAFLDTEFIQLDGRLSFLSLGVVTRDGRELYLELDQAEVAAIAPRANAFVRTHVLPQLRRNPQAQASLQEMAARFRVWVDGLGCSEVELVYDHSGDYVLVEELLKLPGGDPQASLLPTNVSYLLEDPEGIQAAEECWAAVEASRGLKRHHALADSLALAARFRAVHGD